MEEGQNGEKGNSISFPDNKDKKNTLGKNYDPLANLKDLNNQATKLLSRSATQHVTDGLPAEAEALEYTHNDPTAFGGMSELEASGLFQGLDERKYLNLAKAIQLSLGFFTLFIAFFTTQNLTSQIQEDN